MSLYLSVYVMIKAGRSVGLVLDIVKLVSPGLVAELRL